MAGYKPSDLFVGLVDLFSVLIPGGLLVALFSTELLRLSEDILPDLSGDARGWVAFAVAALVAGHVLAHLSSLLMNRLYRALYFPRFCGRLRELEARVEAFLESKPESIDAFTWSRSFVRATNPATAHEIERFEADSKFFRSLSLVVAAAAVQAAIIGAWLTMLASVALMFFAIWRFFHLRRQEAKRVYEYFVLLKAEGGVTVKARGPGGAT